MTNRRSVILRPHEARRMAAHGEVLCVRVVVNPKDSGVNVQDAEWVEPYANALGHTGRWSFKREMSKTHPCHGKRWACNSIAIDTLYCPFGRVGDVLVGLESFARRDDFDWRADLGKTLCYIHYRADYNGDLGDEWHNYGKWRSASTMPRELSRFPRLVPEKIEVRRITTVTEDEAIATGLLSEWDKLDGRAYDNAKKAACRLMRSIDLKAGFAGNLGKFAASWVRQHGRDAEAWADDAWCWFATLKVSDAC